MYQVLIGSLVFNINTAKQIGKIMSVLCLLGAGGMYGLTAFVLIGNISSPIDKIAICISGMVFIALFITGLGYGIAADIL